MDAPQNKSDKKIRLIATDLDGTLLDGTGNIPPRNRDALVRAMARGVIVTIATGRMFHSANRFAAEIGVKVPLICYNGAMVRYPDGRTLYHHRLDMSIARRALAIFRERRIYVQSYIEDVLYIRDAGDEEFVAYLKHFGIEGRAIGDDLYAPSVAPTKLLAMTDDIEASHALMREFQDLFGPDLYVTSSNANFVELMNPVVNKARSLTALAGDLGVPMENVMTLGDGENDVEMLRAAGTGVAMANGRQSAKDAADAVAPTGDECGVAWAVEKYALK
ncbi:Cof-type HAD-IIB family hydrolase [Synergistaceae bacterium OttesenSCG-928-I11]|nr:Cof-type HAD-IIB family hydrolase [Synergistaceae bacterium OttesenSCG-928-I11]